MTHQGTHIQVEDASPPFLPDPTPPLYFGGSSPAAGPVAADHSEDDRSELVRALQQLPPMQRKVVVLRHWLDLSVEETSRELGISTGTVKSHTSRGLAALHVLLSAERVESRSNR